MFSTSHGKFLSSMLNSEILLSFNNNASPVSTDQNFINQICFKSSIAQAVGCLEFYVESVLKEFIFKTRSSAKAKTWTLIAQFDVLAEKITSDFNTPNWDNIRNIMHLITGIDPYQKWIWSPKFTNQTDTKIFYDEILIVRHSFAHGFDIPSNLNNLPPSGKIDLTFNKNAILFIKFIAASIDNLLEHDLIFKHSCNKGWI